GHPFHGCRSSGHRILLCSRNRAITARLPWAPSTMCPAPVFAHYLHDIESLFWIGLHSLFSTIPTTYLQDLPERRDKQYKLYNSFFPHYLPGCSERRRFIQRTDFQTTEEVLPDEYRDTMRRLLRIPYVLAYDYRQVENIPHFPRQEHFDNVYGTDQPKNDVFLAFEAVMNVAYNGETKLLLPHDPIRIKQLQRALTYREINDEGDRGDDQTYIFSDLGHAEGLEDDEEPPSKVRRKNGKTKAAGSSHHTHRESVEGIHSMGSGKRKRQL
ncbi:hypothetical protein IW262DRAFT_1523034, partial [Armillaria fumosa]